MIRNFSPNEFSRLVKKGIEGVRYENEIRTKEQVYALICQQIPSLTPDVLRNWTRPSHRKNPVMPSDLSLFAELCLTISPKLGIEWVENLFARNGLSSKDMSDSLSAICQELIANTGQKNLVAESHELLESYRNAVIEWAQLFKLFSGINYKIGDGFIHSKIRRDFRSGNSQNMTGKIRAEELIHKPNVKAGIIGVAGIGKSTLWQYLAGVATRLTNLSFPIPIDSRSFQDGMSTYDVIYNAIYMIWPACNVEKLKKLANILIQFLEDGSAIALFDNWEWTPDHLKLISRWKRVLSFTRQPVTRIDASWETYNLESLDNGDVWEFVRSWPHATGMMLDTNTLNKQIAYKKISPALVNTPSLLDMICMAFTQPDFSGRQSYDILKQALIFQTEQVYQYMIEPIVFRAALSDFGLDRFRTTGTQSFSATEALRFWASRFSNEDAQLYLRLAQECNVLKQHKDKLTFSHPMVHAVLTAQAWSLVDQADLYLELENVKHNPLWADVIVFTFSILSNAADKQADQYMDLINFLNHLCSGESDISESIWLLAGQCVSVLSPQLRMILARDSTIQIIGEHLIENIHQLISAGLDHKKYSDVLLTMFTSELVYVINDKIYSKSVSKDEQLFWLELLGRIPDSNSLVVLRNVAEDARVSRSLRQEAIIAIGATGLDAAIPFLERWLYKKRFGKSSTFRFPSSLWEEWATSKHLAPYKKEIKHEQNQYKTTINISSNNKLRYFGLGALVAHNSLAAAQLLQNINQFRLICGMHNLAILPLFEHALAKDLMYAEQYIKAISYIGGDEAVLILEKILHKADYRIGSIIATQLGSMQTKRASSALAAFMRKVKPLSESPNIAISSNFVEPFSWDAKQIIDVLINLDENDYHVDTCIRILQNKKDVETRTIVENAFMKTHDLIKQRWLARILSRLDSRIIVDWLQKKAKVENNALRIEAIIDLLHLNEPSALDRALTEIEDGLSEKRYCGHLYAALVEVRIDKNHPRLLPILWRALTEGSGQGEDVAFSVIIHLDCTTLIDEIINGLRVWMPQNPYPKREWFLRLLARLGTPRAIEAIIQYALPAGHDSPITASEAVQSLSTIRNLSSLETLFQALLNTSDEVRYGALFALNGIRDENSIPYIIPLLSDQNELIVHAVLWTLQQLEPLANLRIAQYAIDLLRNPKSNFRRAALIILEKAPAKVATQQLLTQIEQILLEDQEEQVRYQAMITLGRLGKERSQNVLLKLFNRETNYIRSEEIAQILLAVGDASIVGILNATLKNMDHELWLQLIQPRFLCGLIAEMPRTKPLLMAFCVKYNVRIMADGTVTAWDGRQFSCKKFQERLLIE